MILIILGVIAAIVMPIVIAFFWIIGTYNTLQKAVQDIKEQWSNILTEYQRRADLLINLASTVKSFKKHEKETLTEVIKARAQGITGTKPQQMAKLKGFEGALSKLMVLIEKYPDLKANEQHNTLMTEVRMTEDRINVSRTDYNAIVGDYNTYVKTFPNSLVANHFRFKLEKFFELVDKSADKAPRLEL